ncbi:MAG: hypothetical protein RLZZ330_152 [Actinomycetota bacterium]|jgi:tRNA U34 5-carboxymethylaminomethyl modifying GTPase MnmE/TrmE
MKKLITGALVAILAIAPFSIASASASDEVVEYSVVANASDAVASYNAELSSYQSQLAAYEVSAKTHEDFKQLKAAYKPLKKSFNVAKKAIDRAFKNEVKAAKEIRRAALTSATSAEEKTAARSVFAQALALSTANRSALLATIGDLPQEPIKVKSKNK